MVRFGAYLWVCLVLLSRLSSAQCYISRPIHCAEAGPCPSLNFCSAPPWPPRLAC